MKTQSLIMRLFDIVLYLTLSVSLSHTLTLFNPLFRILGSY